MFVNFKALLNWKTFKRNVIWNAARVKLLQYGSVSNYNAFPNSKISISKDISKNIVFVIRFNLSYFKTKNKKLCETTHVFKGDVQSTLTF